jgi:hypothetical protein
MWRGSAHDRTMYIGILNDMYGACNNMWKTQIVVFPPLIRYVGLIRLLVLKGHLHLSDVWSITLFKTKQNIYVKEIESCAQNL